MQYIKFMLFILFSFFLNNIYSIKTEISLELPDQEDSKENCLCNKYLQPLKAAVTPESTIFAFDLHDVLFYKNPSKILFSALKTLKNGLIWYTLNPFFLKKALSIARQDRIWEDIFYKLMQEYPGLEKYKSDFFDISNSCCEPIGPMIEMLTKLKDKNYKLFLLSNIGGDSYQDFKSRFSNIMDIFDGAYLPSKENNYAHKPNSDYYQGFLDYLKELKLENKQIIFIDDLSVNLDGALNFGIAGIHCICPNYAIEIIEQLAL